MTNISVVIFVENNVRKKNNGQVRLDRQLYIWNDLCNGSAMDKAEQDCSVERTYLQLRFHKEMYTKRLLNFNVLYSMSKLILMKDEIHHLLQGWLACLSLILWNGCSHSEIIFQDQYSLLPQYEILEKLVTFVISNIWSNFNFRCSQVFDSTLYKGLSLSKGVKFFVTINRHVFFVDVFSMKVTTNKNKKYKNTVLLVAPLQ